MSNAIPLEIGAVAKVYDRTASECLARITACGLHLCHLGGVSDALLFGPERASQVAAFRRELKAREITVNAVWVPYRGQAWGFVDGPPTLGLVPEATRAERMVRNCMAAQLAADLGVDTLASHVGFIPHEDGECYRRFVADMRRFLEFCQNQGQRFIFETGQEPVAVLERFFRDLEMPNIGLNFDPANLLIYNFDDPEVLVERLGAKVVNMHIKDGRRPTQPATLGCEERVGEGDAKVLALVRRLHRGFGYTGPLVIEREIADEAQQQADIRKTAELLQGLRQELGL